jgi:hypothetical protein
MDTSWVDAVHLGAILLFLVAFVKIAFGLAALIDEWLGEPPKRK